MDEVFEIVVPFTGFYESNHGAVLDDAIEYELEPEEGRRALPYDDLIIDTKGFYKEYAEAYVRAVVNQLEDDSDISVSMELKEVNSPKEYNFVTDQIIATINGEGIKALMEETDWTAMAAIIKEDLTCRSGFYTTRSNNLDDWFYRGVRHWDCVELGYLLEQFVLIHELEVDLGHEIASSYITWKGD